MERRIEQDVDGWQTRPFEEGYEGLRQIASADFSGVVRAGGAWLFFVNGKIVGVFEGDLEDVEGVQGSAHRAPHPSLPLLYAMEATGGDTRAKYYTNDTPIAEVDDTLASGSFTGYVELSENVLSGDYYQLYHGGHSMSVAFVGNSGKMVTGEDAFERADDEVGIYEVVDVDVDVAAVPEPDGTETVATEMPPADTGNEDGTAPDAGADASDATGAEATQDVAVSDDDVSGETPPADPSTDTAATEPTTDRTDGDRSAAADAPPDETSHTTGATAATATPARDDAPSNRDGTRSEGSTASGHQNAEAVDAGATDDAAHTVSPTATTEHDDANGGSVATNSSTEESTHGDSQSTAASGPDGAEGVAMESEPARATGRSSPDQTEAAWREATTVPSLDPANSTDADATPEAPAASSGQSRTGSQQQSADAPDRRRSDDVEETLEQEVLEREDRIDRLQQRVENVENERDDLAEERDRLHERVDSLTEENESLRGEIDDLERQIGELEATAASTDPSTNVADGDATGGSMPARAALKGTDLFVRYDSKSAPTLRAAHDGGADATTVNENLRLDVHTQFEDEGVTIEDQPFETFLCETMAYRFVEWLVRTLPYEIRETGSDGALRDLYDALPEVDRVEFHGEVARDAVEGEEGSPSETFDVVVRDKMGEALLVADMNEARDPATGRMIVDLQEGATRVKEHATGLAGAVFVTRSFFEPAALETASEATSGSLLSRDSRASYVKLSRKQGYHLCLVEARGDDLHLNVPEL